MNTPATPLQFRSADEASAFLSRLSLTDPAPTHRLLLQFFDALVRQPLPPTDQAVVLTQAEKPLAFLQEEAARHYLIKSLPYSGDDLARFQRTVTLWQQAGKAWRAAELPEGSGVDVAAILERALYCHGMALVEHLMARYQVPPGLWRTLHETYQEAERRGVADFPFQDHKGRNLSCSRSYVAVILFELSRPYSLSARELPLVWRWAKLMAKLARVVPLAENETPAFILDLGSDASIGKPLPGARDAADVRRLDTTDLASHVRKLRRRLDEGYSPKDLLLGEDVSSGDALRLVAHLRYPWSQEAIARPVDLRLPIGSARVVLGYNAIHYQLTGREMAKPKGPAAAHQYSRQDAERLAIFGASRENAASVRDQTAVKYSGETWALLEESASAYRIYRAGDGAKVAPGQLVALSLGHEPNAPFFLTQISSLMQTPEGGVVAKVRRLLGTARGVAIQALGTHLPAQALVGGFLIEAAGSDADAKPQLVMPRGWYQRLRPVELDLEPPLRCRLEKVLLSGHDFDLVECAPFA
ncbi:MAG TPA: hypothetical protein VJ548_11035 [Azospira sp.]|nr:hypothetical protein [Azospira sp.]